MYRLSILFLLLFPLSSYTQTPYFVVHQILIKGNKTTKDYIIRRELEFKEGDTLSTIYLPMLLEKSRENLDRSRLFFQTDINWKQTVKDDKEYNVIEVVVQEAWYLYPVPILELADRNFNTWWTEMNGSLRRLNFGVRLDHLNVTGRRDKLKLKLQGGYTQKYEVAYIFPHLGKTGHWGLSWNVLYSQNKEIGYQTEHDKLRFYKSDNTIYKRRRVTLTGIYRPRFRQTHEIKLEWYANSISEEEVLPLNPEYFIGQRKKLRWWVLEYVWKHNGLNHFNYPTRGILAQASLRKEGLGITRQVDLFTLELHLEKYISFGPEDKWSLGLQSKVRKRWPNKYPGYYHNTALGYGQDQLRGYEYYVIDGRDFLYQKTAVNFLVIDHSKSFGHWVFIDEFQNFKMKVYLAAALDLGYVRGANQNSTNTLGNTLLLGGGPAVHILFYNYFLLRAEYSLNRQGEKGLFLHFNASF